MLKELFKGSVIYGVAPFVPKILSVLLLPVLTKYLTSTDYGIIGTITAVTTSVQAMQDLGMRVLLQNYFYKSKSHYKVIWREIYGFLSLWLIAYASLQAALLYFFIPDEASDNKWLIILLSNFSTVFFGPTSLIGQLYFQLNLKPTPVAFRIIIGGIVTILTNFLCVVVYTWGYMGAYIGSFAGVFIINISYWPVLNRKLGITPIYNFKFKTIIGLLKVGVPTIPHYYSGYLMNTSNIVAMNYYNYSQTEIGRLSISQTIGNMFSIVIDSINRVFAPMSYGYIRDNNSGEMRRLLFSYILMTYSITFLYSLWSREVYGVLISNVEIAATYKYSIIFVMALNYRPLYVYCINYFFYYENTLKMLGITFMAGIVSCVFYFTMIPSIGVYAALIGFYLGCIYLGYSGYIYSFYKSHTIYKIQWLKFLLLQLFLTVIVYSCADLSIYIKLTISLFFITIISCFFVLKIKANVQNLS